MAEVGAPISLDGVAVHPDCWCICLCYLHFAPENPADGRMYLLVLAHPACPRQSPENCKMVVVVPYLVCNVVHDNCSLGATVVHRCQTVVPLLACGVPDLKLNNSVVETNCLRQECSFRQHNTQQQK